MIIFLISFQFVNLDTLFFGNILKTEYKNIVKYSDTIICRGNTLQRNIHYSIDYASGEIYFFNFYNDSLNIRFKVMPDFVKERYSIKHKIQTKDLLEKADSLNIEGTSGIYFDFSNSGRNLEQSLDVKIGGNVGEFNIEGTIKDQDVPYEMGIVGITDVENLYLSIKSHDKSFIIGNFMRDNKRRITGGAANYKIFNIDAGISGEKIGSVYMNGMDGISSGYKIKDSDGNDIRIIQGSEKVFLNGEMLKYKEDYTIDYENAEISFTSKRIIKSGDIIYVSFQYYSGGAKEIIYSFGAKTKNFDVSFESLEDFNEEFLLRKVVSDSGFAYVFDATFVGTGKGDYDLFDSIFVYKGVKKGSYLVKFSYKGENNGEYEYIDSLGYFIYTGVGKWSVIRKIPLYGKNRSVKLKIDSGNKFIKILTRNEITKKDIFITDSTNLSFTTLDNIKIIFPIFTMNFDLYANTNLRKEIEWINYPQNINTWGERVNKYFMFSNEIKPLEYLTIFSGFGKSGDKKLISAGLNFKSMEISYFKVKDFKREIVSSISFKRFKVYLKETRFKDINIRETGIDAKQISFNTGRKGINVSDVITDTSCFYALLFNLPYKFISYSGNANIEKSFIDGSRRMNFNNTIFSGLERKFWGYKILFNIQEGMRNKLIAIYKRVEEGYGNYSYDSLNKRYYEDPFGSFKREFIPSDTIEKIRVFNLEFNTRVMREFLFNLDSKFSFDKLKKQESYNVSFESPVIFKNRYFAEYKKNKSIFNETGLEGLDFYEAISGGINVWNNVFKIGFSRENKKEEKRNFIFVKFVKLVDINVKTGFINYNQSIFFFTLNPELVIMKKYYNLNLGLDISYYKTEFPTPLYQDGIVVSFIPNLTYKIHQYRIIFKGLGRIKNQGNIFSFKIGIETDIKP